MSLQGKFLATFFTVAVALISISCHKSKSSAPQSKIIYIIDSQYSQTNPPGKRYDYAILYNPDGTLHNIQSMTPYTNGNIDSMIFTYASGFVLRKLFVNGMINGMDTFFLNSLGDIYKATSSAYSYALQYSGNEIITSAYSSGYTNVWSGGNNIKLINAIGSDSIINTFYSDMAYAPGEYYYMTEFLQWGRPLTHDKNLIASSIYPGNLSTIDNYTYTFDSKNRIISCILTESTNKYYESFQLQYDN